MFHVRTKYVEIDYHFICEKVFFNQILVQFLCSRDQLADIFTKSLPRPRFKLLQAKLTVAQAPSACRGAVIQHQMDVSIPNKQQKMYSAVGDSLPEN
jgi:hypothetical protein